MIDKCTAGKRIGSLRKGLGYSQAKFADILGVSSQAVSKWETGVSLPDIDVLLNMSWICKVPINEILEDSPASLAIGVDKEYLSLNHLLMCPVCRKRMQLNYQNANHLYYECENAHRYHITDGVVDFRVREIPGEEWSLSYRNYSDYLQDHKKPENPNYQRGIQSADVIWKEIERLRPRIVLDMACGVGLGIKQQIRKINWPVTIIMTDLSHRILKWNRKFYSTEWKNPYVEMIYLACDGSALPILDKSVDVVYSYAGFDSMQAKMKDGFREAFRVLKNNGTAIYTKSTVEDLTGENSRRWMDLLFSRLNDSERVWWKEFAADPEQWTKFCEETGFTENTKTRIYGELPAPETDQFPFKHEFAQWMAEYVYVSKKP